MIQLPQRSVTRFFIPLIDVLTLLFCIFLVLPLAKPESGQAGDDSADGAEQRAQPKNDDGKQLRQEKSTELQKRLAVRVLEIDADSGKLYYRDPQRILLPDEATAHALIENDRRTLGRKELYYLILYPRNRDSTYPTQGQKDSYDRWFRGVALGYDIPGAVVGGAQP